MADYILLTGIHNKMVLLIQQLPKHFGDPKGYGETEAARVYRELLLLAGVEVEA